MNAKTLEKLQAALRIPYGNKGRVTSFSPTINDEEKKSKIKTNSVKKRNR